MDLLNTPLQGDGYKLLRKVNSEITPLVFFDPQYEKVANVLTRKDYPLIYQTDNQINRFICEIERALEPNGYLCLWINKGVLLECRVPNWLNITETLAENNADNENPPYEELLTNLSAEEIARERKKQAREEARKNLKEAEIKRRQEKLSEMDRKLQEEEERKKQEKGLEIQEQERKRKAEEARNQQLKEQQEAYLSEKLRQIEEKKKRTEENLATKKQEVELEEQRKQEEIEQIKRENEQEEARLKKQAELIEEETKKRLEAVALEDKEERQRIEKRANEEKARIEAEILEKKRQNEADLKKKENALLKEKQEKQLELDKLQQDIDLQKTLGEETKRLGREQERILREQKGLSNQLTAFRESLWQTALNYYWVSSEASAGTRSPNLNQSGHLREWLNSYPNMEFNLNFGDIMNDINWSGYKTAMQAFYRTAGNRFVNQYQFKQLLEQKVKSLDFLS